MRHRMRWRPRLWMVVVLAVGIWLVPGVLKAASGPVAPQRPHTVTIQPGDTLWHIAEQWQPNKDPRVTVARLMAVNHLKSPALVPGQVLVLPTN